MAAKGTHGQAFLVGGARLFDIHPDTVTAPRQGFGHCADDPDGVVLHPAAIGIGIHD